MPTDPTPALATGTPDLRAAARGPLGGVLGLRKLVKLYEAVAEREDPDAFLAGALGVLGVSWMVGERDLARVPRQGALVVVANHPFGGLEGMVLALALRSVRRDLKVLANGLLTAIPELAPILIPLDPFERPSSVTANLRGLREALAWLGGGGSLAVFPSGEVAHLHPQRLRVDEPRWRGTVVRLIRHSGACVLPVFFRGCNGPGFHLMGLLHPMLRTALLPRQLLNKRGATIQMSVGEPVPSSRIASGDERTVARRLRERTLLLAQRAAAPRPRRGRVAEAPLGPPQPPGLLAAEVERLPPGQLLAASGGLVVLWAEAAQVPVLLQEIGLRREETFRLAGEGTGRPLDLDRFDARYLHLVLWHRERRELVGAYRLGPTDRLLAADDHGALYTSTLFRFRPELFRRLGPALELGRSFVRSEHQRSFSALLLLWRGIGEFVVRQPRYRFLFGPVSISADYQRLSRALMARFLIDHLRDPELARLVRPRRPFRALRHHRRAVTPPADLDEISSLIAHLEADQKGIPVLLRQYLKLGARVLGLNLDPDFSEVLDALVLVDLCRTDPRVLERYLGHAGARSFLAHHRGRDGVGTAPAGRQ